MQINDPEASAPAPAAARGPSPSGEQRLHRSEILVAVAALIGGTILTFVFLATRPAASAESPTPAAPLAAAAPGDVTLASGYAPAWSDAGRVSWLGQRRDGVAYEVAADRLVPVWMRTVRPSLVVRCTGGKTEVFVFTDSPARIERDTPDHTVRYQLDAEDEQRETWPDADAHDALFAPDGAVFAARLARAQTLRFAFTPHNAPEAVVQFNVAGLAPLLNAAAKDCGGAR